MFAGSSPLTRGTRIDSGQNDRFNRFIPAYAGNSCSNAPVSATIPVHPRLRGELTSRGLPFMVVIGSSPLTRGTRERRRSYQLCCSVHPRLRGELPAPIAAVAVMDGSSPLTRGTQTIVFRVLRRVRFIPAYAGNSQDNRRGRKLAPGSSPLTRGTRPLSYYPRKTKTVHPRLRGELGRYVWAPFR